MSFLILRGLVFLRRILMRIKDERQEIRDRLGWNV